MPAPLLDPDTPTSTWPPATCVAVTDPDWFTTICSFFGSWPARRASWASTMWLGLPTEVDWAKVIPPMSAFSRAMMSAMFLIGESTFTENTVSPCTSTIMTGVQSL